MIIFAPRFDRRLQEGVVSVKDAAYGARGDGLADDTDALQHALDDAHARVVLLPRGIYRVSRTVSIPRNPLARTSGWSITFKEKSNLKKPPFSPLT